MRRGIWCNVAHMELLSSDAARDRAYAFLSTATEPLLVVVGPTASGKTAWSVDLALEVGQRADSCSWIGAEVINADSRQLYRHLDIGTAKITHEEMRGIPHHLFDVLDPDQEVNIAWYKEQVTRVIGEVHARRHVPILVGGSMLYVSAVVDGLDPLPEASPEMRARLEAEYDADDGWTLYARLQDIDPQTAAAFESQNKQYVVRALELFETTGIIPSKLKKKIPPPYQICTFGMHWSREELKRRIEERTSALLERGWIEEVEGLMDRGYSVGDPAMKSHGYREIAAWLQSEERDRGVLAAVIARKTVQYAKRQMTWWGNDDRIQWIDGRSIES